jgi:hypothetical protein
MPTPPAPLPVIRDLLGIVRLLWRARAEAGASVAELDAIRAIGESLGVAVDLATKSGRGTMGERAALQRADEALVQLSIYIADQGVSVLLAAAEGRLRVARRGR